MEARGERTASELREEPAAKRAQQDARTPQDGHLVDKDDRPVEGPLSYGNVTDDGTVTALDAERLRRKEHPGQPLYRNKPRGIGFADWWVSHVSARQWNWKAVLALFRKIVAWSAFMREPDTLKSRLYKRVMRFEPREEKHSYGTVYNLNVTTAAGPGADAGTPGTQAFNDARRAENGTAHRERPGHYHDHPADLSAPENRKWAPIVEEYARRQEERRANPAAPLPGDAIRKIVLNKTVYQDAGKAVVPMDLVKKAIMEANYIGGMKECLCRAGQDCQEYPHDLACLFLNRGGQVIVEHGMAVELTKEEALARVDKAAEYGLACQSLWVDIEQLIWGFRKGEMDSFLEICFCCPCCCVAFNLSKNATPDVRHRFSPTGWTAVVDHGKCTGCRECASTYCPQRAVRFRASDGKMVVDQEHCVGCGICKAHCGHGAIAIKQTMPMRDDVHDYFYEEGRLDIQSLIEL